MPIDPARAKRVGQGADVAFTERQETVPYELRGPAGPVLTGRSFADRTVQVRILETLEAQTAGPQLEVAVQQRQRLPNLPDQVVVDALGHVVRVERGPQTGRVAP